MTFSPNGIYTALVAPFTEDDTFASPSVH
jgi:hypothetical protein